MGNPTVKINMCNSRQCYKLNINDGEPKISVRQPVTSENLPAGLVKLAFKDAEVPDTYSQTFQISFPKGKTKLVFGHPQRGLMPVRKK